MSSMIILTAAILVLGALYVLLPVAFLTWTKFRGKRLVTCPENRQPAAVEVDSRTAGITALFGEPRLQLKACSRWPEREDCWQECLREIESAPEECLVRTIVAKWYEGKSCAICHRPFGETPLPLGGKPALLGPDGITREWVEFPPEDLPRVLSTHEPACWSCHLAETFRREYADLVVDRPARHP